MSDSDNMLSVLDSYFLPNADDVARKIANDSATGVWNAA